MNIAAQFMSLLALIVVVAIVAVVVSNKAQTPAVVTSFFGGFSKSIGAAVSPVVGGISGY